MARIQSKTAHKPRRAASLLVAPAQYNFPILASVCTRQGQQCVPHELYKCRSQVLREV